MGDVHTAEPASVEGAGMRDRLGGYLPILSWGPTYPRGWFGRDAIAGLTLWGLVVPEGMAYAGIADLPPQAGLYTLVVSLAIYALMGTSRHLSVGPTSATAALLASSVTTAVIATAGDADGPRDVRRQRGGVRAGHRAGVPGRRDAAAGVRHAVPVQAGHGRLRDGPGGLRGGGAAEQAVRRGEARGQHRAEVRRDHPGAARGQLGGVRDRRREPRRAVRAAAGEPEAPGGTGGAVRHDPGQQVAGPRGHPRCRGGGHPAPGPAVADVHGRPAGDLPGDGAAGHRGVPRRVQRVAGRGPRVRRQARLRGRRQPGAQRPRRHEHPQLVVRRDARRRGHVRLGGQGGGGRQVPGREPGRVGGDGRHAAVPHAAVRHPARGGARCADHPCGLAPHRLAQAAHPAPRVADRVLVRAAGHARRAAHRRAGGHDHRPGRVAGVRGLPVQPPAPGLRRADPRRPGRVLRPGAAPGEHAGARAC